MAVPNRRVAFDDAEEHFYPDEIQELHVNATKSCCPKPNEIAQRGAEVREEKDRLQQSRDQMQALLALGEAAQLRGEVMEDMFGLGQRANDDVGLHQDGRNRVACRQVDRLQALDADDVEYFAYEEQALAMVDMYLNELCENIGVPRDAHRQALTENEPVPWPAVDPESGHGEEQYGSSATSAASGSGHA